MPRGAARPATTDGRARAADDRGRGGHRAVEYATPRTPPSTGRGTAATLPSIVPSTDAPEITGAVYATATGDRAAFLTGTDLDILRTMLDVLEARPTVAGPPLDVESLRRLARAVDIDGDHDAPSSPIVLSEGEQRCLELLRDQAVIREKLPMRIRQTCTACGDERIINPARQAAAAQTARSNVTGQSLLASAQLLSEGHPVLATLNFLGGLGSSGDPAEKPPVCPRCEGDEYDNTPATFCPGCRALRDEAVLLRCPECDFEFLARRGGDEPLWIPTPQAVAQLNRARNRAAVRRRAKDFENGLWPNQLQALVDALDADDEPIVMCRCGRPGEVGRYLALLVTSEHLVWAWESPLSGTKSGKVHWRDVRTIHELGTPANAQNRGLRVESVDGDPVAVVNIRGVGVSFADPPAGSTVEDLLTLMSGLHRRHGGSGQVVPAPSVAPPAEPPAPEPEPVRVPVAAGPPAPTPVAAVAAPPSTPPPPAGPAVGVASVPTTQPAPPPEPTSPPPPPYVSPPSPSTPAPPPGPPTGPADRLPPAGWYADPWRAARVRWWSGTQWTGHTSQ